MTEKKIRTIIVKLSEEDRKNNHIPDEVFKLSRDNNVWIEDFKSHELVQILDLTDGKIT